MEFLILPGTEWSIKMLTWYMYLSISQAPNESEVETDFAHPSYHHMNSYLWFPLQSMFSSVHGRPPNLSC